MYKYIENLRNLIGVLFFIHLELVLKPLNKQINVFIKNNFN